jgi:hypothetical protein
MGVVRQVFGGPGLDRGVARQVPGGHGPDRGLAGYRQAAGELDNFQGQS